MQLTDPYLLFNPFSSLNLSRNLSIHRPVDITRSNEGERKSKPGWSFRRSWFKFRQTENDRNAQATRHTNDVTDSCENRNHTPGTRIASAEYEAARIGWPTIKDLRIRLVPALQISPIPASLSSAPNQEFVSKALDLGRFKPGIYLRSFIKQDRPPKSIDRRFASATICA